jgi:LDH2 family malate/lactate/ureidoglycolate dehydrogenase
LFGTNPLAIAAPGEGDEVFSLDMATSQVAFSRLKLYRQANRPLAPGWAVDAAGQNTTDPHAANAMSPLGGYKGAGLAFAVQILTALLAGGSFDHELTNVLTPTGEGIRDVSHIFGVIDIAKFVEPGTFRRRLSFLLRTLRGSAAAGSESVKAPGDLESAAFKERRQNGIPIDPSFFETLVSLAPEISPPAPIHA